MSQLDRLLEVMRDARGEVLTLRADDVAHVLRHGSEQPMTKQPLTRAQVLSLVREKAPSTLHAELQAGHPVAFQFDGPGGRYEVDARISDAACEARIKTLSPQAHSPNGAAPRPADPARKTAIDALLTTMIQRRASDLHLRSGVQPLVRIDGQLVSLDGQQTLGVDVIRDMLHAIMGPHAQQEFARTHDADFAYEIAGLARFRGNAFVDRHGPAAVFRAIPSKIVTAEELGLSSELQALCQLTKGLVLVTGPTGSGKSTTLCALIDLVNRTRHDHIVTIEDPIEFVHERKGCLVTQRQVGLHTGSFKHALRAALREDPDVVLVGELRDLETMAIAIETAETGHLVFGTLHTSTAASTIDRIIDQFPSDRQAQVRVMLSESVKGVISQVLCRKIGGGRVAAMEVLLSTPALSNLIREAKTFQIPSVMQTSRKLGMVTLNDALLELVDKGQIEVREAYLRATDKNAIVQGLLSRGHDASFADAAHSSGGGNASGAGGASPAPGRGAPMSRPNAASPQRAAGIGGTPQRPAPTGGSGRR
ncbi:MAG TPA: type IV pilus twitching motility protein PilT [Gemmatimonadaceae bacterium]|jgi:twitching motility protein PilT|nr:type IV pilus twitching motility protein PilT [Gemmatimonadaceae bacterium]